MKILLVGSGPDNHNYKKIEGFYKAFSKMGNVEWVQDIFDCKSTNYDICFAESNIDTVINRIEEYKSLKIKKQIFWTCADIHKLIKIATVVKETSFINAYKSNVLDDRILIEYQNKFGGEYQKVGWEGINISDYLNIGSFKIDNLILFYLPCCLSEQHDFVEEKIYDICYFGTIRNRPNVARVIDALSSKYNIIVHAWDRDGIKHPEECYNLYKQSKITLSEQVHPVILEYPVRMGESTSTGCKLFLLEEISIKSDSDLIPEYESCFSYSEMIEKIENYLSNFKIENSKKIYDQFLSTYDNAVQKLLNLYPS